MTPRLQSWITCLGLAGLSAGLLNLAYFPINCGIFAAIGLAPFLVLTRVEASRIARYLSGWVGGLLFFYPAMCWMAVAHAAMFAAWIALSIYCSTYFVLMLFLLRRLDARTGWPLTLTAPLVIVSAELLRGWALGGFPWYYLGHAWHDYLSMVQTADLAGVAAVSATVAAVNGLIAEWISRPQRRMRYDLIAVAIVLAATAGYGQFRLRQTDFAVGPRVALLQSNQSQELRNDVVPEGMNAEAIITAQMVALTRDAMRERPDLIVWPETTFVGEHNVPAPGYNLNELKEFASYVEASRNDLAQAGLSAHTFVLLGLITKEYGPEGMVNKFNSGVLVGPDGVVRGRYDKTHLVPFGEYVPLGESLPFLKRFTPYQDREYVIKPGRTYPRLEVPAGDRRFHFGVLICYEDSVAEFGRAYLGRDPVDFFVNISNDGWFRCSAEHEQHLAISRFRAIEARRTLVRAVNIGISAVIDPNGAVTHLPADSWVKSKGVVGVVVADVPVDNRTSVFSWAGDWLSWLSAAGTLLGMFGPRRWWRRGTI